MKALGCLVVIVVLCVGIFWLMGSSADLGDEDKAHVAGQKVHRGWNRMQGYARSFQEGWKSADEDSEKDK